MEGREKKGRRGKGMGSGVKGREEKGREGEEKGRKGRGPPFMDPRYAPCAYPLLKREL